MIDLFYVGAIAFFGTFYIMAIIIEINERIR